MREAPSPGGALLASASGISVRLVCVREVDFACWMGGFGGGLGAEDGEEGVEALGVEVGFFAGEFAHEVRHCGVFEMLRGKELCCDMYDVCMV